MVSYSIEVCISMVKLMVGMKCLMIKALFQCGYSTKTT